MNAQHMMEILVKRLYFILMFISLSTAWVASYFGIYYCLLHYRLLELNLVLVFTTIVLLN